MHQGSARANERSSSSGKPAPRTHAHAAARTQDDLERLRGVYEEFLPAYPLCFGYWRKYAEAENRHGHVDKALEVRAPSRLIDCLPTHADHWRTVPACMLHSPLGTSLKA